MLDSRNCPREVLSWGTHPSEDHTWRQSSSNNGNGNSKSKHQQHGHRRLCWGFIGNTVPYVRSRLAWRSGWCSCSPEVGCESVSRPSSFPTSPLVNFAVTTEPKEAVVAVAAKSPYCYQKCNQTVQFVDCRVPRSKFATTVGKKQQLCAHCYCLLRSIKTLQKH